MRVQSESDKRSGVSDTSVDRKTTGAPSRSGHDETRAPRRQAGMEDALRAFAPLELS